MKYLNISSTENKKIEKYLDKLNKSIEEFSKLSQKKILEIPRIKEDPKKISPDED